MTTEEKARAYDEALKKAKEIKEKIISSHLSTESCKAVSEYIDTIIPELAESEDEKIIDTLIWLVEGRKKNRTTAYGDVKIDDILAWLEKQKERGPLTKEEEYELHRIIEYLEDETCPSEWISLLHDIYCLPYEKKKEQKPSEEQESVAERFARIVRGNLIGIDEKAQHEFEQLYFEITGNKMYGGYND